MKPSKVICSGLCAFLCIELFAENLYDRRQALDSAISRLTNSTTDELTAVLFNAPSAEVAFASFGELSQFWYCAANARGILSTIWAAAGIFEQADNFGTLTNVLTRQNAGHHLMRTAAFDILCGRDSAASWTFMKSRATNEPALIDLCISGVIVWGSKFPLLPPQPGHTFSLNDRPPDPARWRLPATTSSNWAILAACTNGVYRQLAVTGLRTWANSNDTTSAVRSALRDAFYFTRKEALYHLARLSPDQQIMLCTEYLEWSSSINSTNEPARNANKSISAEIEKRLQAHKQ